MKSFLFFFFIYGALNAQNINLVPKKERTPNVSTKSNTKSNSKTNKKTQNKITKLKKDCRNKYDDAAFDYTEERERVSKNEKYGFVNSSGEEIIPLQYDNVMNFSDGLAPVKKNGKWNFVNTSGKEVSPLQYDDASPFSQSRAAVKKNDKLFYINKQGKCVKDCHDAPADHTQC